MESKYIVKIVTDILGITTQVVEKKEFSTEQEAVAYFKERRAKAIKLYEERHDPFFPKRIIKDLSNKFVIDDRISGHFVHISIKND